jgi:NAD(P)-dependent dehydrogenase (short-subunit alcohol dehydrogenase family)/spore coat polysaccharide biosynthesis protein SpsF (cytidylyltransferase family)
MISSIHKIPAFITVRTGSSRLPNKCFLTFGEVTVLEHVILRAKYYDLEPIICTSLLKQDDQIIELANKYKIKSYRGPIQNKMLRWSNCCEYFNISSFHTIDADDPFFCGEEVRRSFLKLKEGFDVIYPTISSSSGGATVGCSITAKAIKIATINTKDDTDTESVSDYFSDIPEFKTLTLSEPNEHIITSRMTLDYKEDYLFLETLRNNLGNMATRKEIYNYLKDNSEITRINSFRTLDWQEKNHKPHQIPFELEALFSVDGYDAIVVGGSNGIGASISQCLSINLANVTIFDKEKPNFNEKHCYIKCDISSPESVRNALKKYFDSGGAPKILVNSAGITIPSIATEYSFEYWQKTMSVNLNGLFIITQEIGKAMIEKKIKGSIVNVTSIGAHQGFPNNPAYAASKGGLGSLTRALASEWGEHGIRVNNLTPGYTSTEMNRISWENDFLRRERSNKTILGRWAFTEEMMGPVIFLASEASSYITGIDLVVDGGWLVKGI